MRALSFLLLIIVCGCERSSGGPAVAKKGTAEQTEAGANAALSEARIPEDFPLPVYPNSKVETVIHAKQGFVTLDTRVDAPVDKVADFYKKAMKNKGYEVTRLETEVAGKEQVSLFGQSDDTVMVMLQREDADGGRTSATINRISLGAMEGTLASGKDVDVKDFPLPIFPGAKLTSRWHPKSDAPGQMRSVTAEVSASIDEVVKFYEKAFKDKGLQISTLSLEKEGAKSVIGHSDEFMATVNVTRSPISRGNMFAVYWGKSVSGRSTSPTTTRKR